jgi:hypothetical protein
MIPLQDQPVRDRYSQLEVWQSLFSVMRYNTLVHSRGTNQCNRLSVSVRIVRQPTNSSFLYFLHVAPTMTTTSMRRRCSGNAHAGRWVNHFLLFGSLLVPGEPFSIASRRSSRSLSRSSPFHGLIRAPSRLWATDPVAETIEEAESTSSAFSNNMWEKMAQKIVNIEQDPSQLEAFVQCVTLLRVGLPSIMAATAANLVYPSVAMALARLIDDSGVFAVVSQDASQYIQNILTTSGLIFSILVGQTYYFMYQQQEAIYLALFEEVTMAKSLLEQVALVCQGRESLYHRILTCIDRYVQDDLNKFGSIEPSFLLSSRPEDDPLEDILYLTSVGEPSIIYQTVRSLRQARSYRLGALQRKLPDIHMTLLWTLAAIVLMVFPLLGAGVQTIGGIGILRVQGWYLSFIVFGIFLTMGVINELRRPGDLGAYNAQTVLAVMVTGLEEELDLRLSGKLAMTSYEGPSIDSDGFREQWELDKVDTS